MDRKAPLAPKICFQSIEQAYQNNYITLGESKKLKEVYRRIPGFAIFECYYFWCDSCLDDEDMLVFKIYDEGTFYSCVPCLLKRLE